ncbi:MAG: hypothetical protein Q8M94_11725, partial [Ignavibacteria bacterium]|nr:hypothetical protein [Ignavibacteria bacterium]
MKTIHSALLIILFVSTISAQNINEQNYFTGNLSTDARQMLSDFKEPNIPQFSLPSENKKSPVLAGVLSLLVPGAGEIYTEEYLKAGIFIAIEATAIAVGIIYNNKGDRATEEFQVFANENWSARRYAEWLNNFSVELGITNPPIDLVRVDNKDYSQLNANERQVKVGEKAFSHQLPPYGDQQYYELIGKYHQFNHGWSDSDGTMEWLNNISPKFISYADMHIKPDHIYRVAST